MQRFIFVINDPYGLIAGAQPEIVHQLQRHLAISPDQYFFHGRVFACATRIAGGAGVACQIPASKLAIGPDEQK